MKCILIVEDTDLNVDLLTQLLEDDHKIIVARDGAEGVNMARQHHPDLILMDISLPALDGYEASRRIQAEPGLRSIPIIGLSAHAMSGDEERARAAGCSDYLTKPIDEALLFSLLKKHLGE